MTTQMCFNCQRIKKDDTFINYFWPKILSIFRVLYLIAEEEVDWALRVAESIRESFKVLWKPWTLIAGMRGFCIFPFLRWLQFTPAHTAAHTAASAGSWFEEIKC